MTTLTLFLEPTISVEFHLKWKKRNVTIYPTGGVNCNAVSVSCNTNRKVCFNTVQNNLIYTMLRDTDCLFYQWQRGGPHTPLWNRGAPRVRAPQYKCKFLNFLVQKVLKWL